MITEETYKWIEELLDPQVKEISYEDYFRLYNNYFTEDKSDWLTLNFVAQSKKSRLFWELIRKYVMPKGEKAKVYNFSFFKFPVFENNSMLNKVTGNTFENFWENNKLKVFKYEVKFNNASFHGNLILKDVEFNENVDFSNAIFFKEFGITGNCIFKKNLNFKGAIFKNIASFHNNFSEKVNFDNTKFKAAVNFNNSSFKKHVNLSFVHFEEDVSFLNCNFNQSVSINNSKFDQLSIFTKTCFNNNVDFAKSEFKGETYFFQTSFLRKANFYNCIFFENENLFFRDLKGVPHLNFRDAIFSKTILFVRINFINTTFLESDLTDVTFRECEWGENSRIILYDEKNIDKKDKNQLKSLEVLYRQLKKNFDATKSWELSGKAYVSEMKMRQRRLWLEKKYYQWFIYKFYDVFGGYTQDFRRPIISLIGLILVFSGLYYFIDYDIVKALQRGVKGALPYMQIDTENPFEGYWLILRNLQLVLGGTFLAFFILALRKRFKQ